MIMLGKLEAKRARRQTIGPCCLICGATDRRRVCDHNHETNMIRGTLCELCNSYLDIYERNLLRDKPQGGPKFRAWAAKFEAESQTHLTRNTGQAYHGMLITSPTKPRYVRSGRETGLRLTKTQPRKCKESVWDIIGAVRVV